MKFMRRWSEGSFLFFFSFLSLVKWGLVKMRVKTYRTTKVFNKSQIGFFFFFCTYLPSCPPSWRVTLSPCHISFFFFYLFIIYIDIYFLILLCLVQGFFFFCTQKIFFYRVFKAKYFDRAHFMQAMLCCNASYAWARCCWKRFVLENFH